jgi:hypothetical protein
MVATTLNGSGLFQYEQRLGDPDPIRNFPKRCCRGVWCGGAKNSMSRNYLILQSNASLCAVLRYPEQANNLRGTLTALCASFQPTE